MAALAFKIEHRIDQMLDRLGTCDLAVLGHMADQDHSDAGGFGVAHQIMRGGAHLRDGARCGIERRSPHRLNRIDDQDVGRRRRCESREDILDTMHRAGRALSSDPSARRATAPGRVPLRPKRKRQIFLRPHRRRAPEAPGSISPRPDRRPTTARSRARVRRR